MIARALTWRGPARPGHPEVFAAIALASLLAARFLPVLELGYVCPLRGLAGIPCATCGMTRAFVALAHGDLPAAFAASPLGALLAGGAWLLAALDLVRLAAGWPLPAPSPRAVRVGLALGIGALALNWVYLIARGG